MSYQQSVESDDIESQVSSTAAQHPKSWTPTSPDNTIASTYKAPRARHGSPTSKGTIPKDLPLGASAQQASKRQDILEQVFHTVDTNVCRTHQEPEIAQVMKKRVSIDERQDVDGRPASSLREMHCGDLSRPRQCASPTSSSLPSKSPKSILKKGSVTKENDLDPAKAEPEEEKHGSEPAQSKGDLLDYIFENVESFICRHKNGDEKVNKDDTDGNEESMIENGQSSSPEQIQRLYKVSTTDEVEVKRSTNKRDVLDYLFECGGTDDADQPLRIDPIPTKDRDILDYIFECGEDVLEADSRDPSMRAPLTPQDRESSLSFSSLRDCNSIIDAVSSLDPNDNPRIGRAEILRQKKRQLEEQRRFLEYRGNETRYWIPKGQHDEIAMLETSSRVSMEALSLVQIELERSKRVQRLLIAGMVMSFVGIVWVVIAITLFFPMRPTT